jgi:WD40 repeat protein
MDAELPYFEQARTFTDNKGPINSIDFHRKEDLVVTAGAWSHNAVTRVHLPNSPPTPSTPRANVRLGFSSLPSQPLFTDASPCPSEHESDGSNGHRSLHTRPTAAQTDGADVAFGRGFIDPPGDDDSIHVYNTASGTLHKTLWSKKYGVGCVAFTHHTNAIICASKNNSWDETLRYLSLHDNR